MIDFLVFFRDGSVIVDMEIASLSANETFNETQVQSSVHAALSVVVEDEYINIMNETIPVDPDFVAISRVGLCMLWISFYFGLNILISMKSIGCGMALVSPTT